MRKLEPVLAGTDLGHVLENMSVGGGIAVVAVSAVAIILILVLSGGWEVGRKDRDDE